MRRWKLWPAKAETPQTIASSDLGLRCEFASDNAVIVLGAGASRADCGLLERDLLPAIDSFAKSFTMTIPANDFAKSLGTEEPTFSYVLTYIQQRMASAGKIDDELILVYNSMLEGLVNALVFTPGIDAENEHHVRLFAHVLLKCDKFSVLSLNYDPIAESAITELSQATGRPKLNFWVKFADAMAPLPKRQPFVHAPIDSANPRLGSWMECELTKQSIDVARSVFLSKNVVRPRVLEHSFAQGTVDFLKLHGSIDWFVCSSCGLPHAAWLKCGSLPELKMVQSTLWMIGHHFPGFCAFLCSRCGYPLRPNIMPPGPEGTRAEHGLSEVWERALYNLVHATDWLFIGYSFPTYDTEVRTLLSSAVRSRRNAPRIWVVDYDEAPGDFTTSAVLSRARQIFGADAITAGRTCLGGLQQFPKFGEQPPSGAAQG